MVILHVSRTSAGWCLWGESAKILKKTAKQVANLPQFLPYQVLHKDLMKILAELNIEGVSRSGYLRKKKYALWAPTRDKQAVFSSQLTLDAALEDRLDIALTPWAIEALSLSADELVRFLLYCKEGELISPGVRIGPEVMYLVQVLSYALHMVIRQQFMPSLNDFDEARWEPIFNRENSLELQKFIKTLPQVLRIMAMEISDPLPETLVAGSDGVLHEYFFCFIDQLVRNSQAPEQKNPAHDTIHDQFLVALHSPNAQLKARKPDDLSVQLLKNSIGEWARPIALVQNAPFYLSFHLQEPQKAGDDSGIVACTDDWKLAYFLKAADDPSLLIPIGQALNPEKKIKALFAARNYSSHEYLLFALGQVSQQCPFIAASLAEAIPDHCMLTVDQVCLFLATSVSQIQAAGFEVIIPAWCVHGTTRSRVKATASAKGSMRFSSGLLSLDDIVNFDWVVSLGDTKLSLAELDTLAQLKTPFIKSRGKWIRLEHQSIQKAIAALKNTSQASASDLLKWALGATPKSFEDIDVEGVQNCDWLEESLAKLTHKNACELLPQPAQFKGVLRAYQTEGFSWMQFLSQIGLGACLADDMGLGKTIQTLAFILHNWQQQNSQKMRPTLLICPTSVTENWKREAYKFTPDLPVVVHHGSKRTKSTAFVDHAKKAAIVISSYSLLVRDFDEFKQIKWKAIVFDEAQNIKNAETKQTKAAHSLVTDFKIALTGTPVENSLGDLWSIMQCVNPGFLGTQADFKKKFLVPVQVHKDAEAANLLKKLTGPFILRRLKTDKSIIKDLPDKIESDVFCTLTVEQASLYKAVISEIEVALESAEGIERKGLVLAALLRCKQICDHPALFLKDASVIGTRSGKLERITQMLGDVLERKEKALIFTQFTQMGDLLKDHLEESFGGKVLFLQGSTEKKKRDAMVDLFQRESGPSIFVLSLKAGGVGLNLTQANHVFHFDRWWNPAVENQATDRAFRIGQHKNVLVHKFITQGTVEEKIDEIIKRKQELTRDVISTSEQWITELNNTELKKLFALRKEALGE